MHSSVEGMWRSYHLLMGHALEEPLAAPSSWHFCDNEQDANTCAALVLQGQKRATSPSLWYFESRGEPLPKAGDLHVITNWIGEAQCIIRTTHVEIVPLNEISEAHAAAEGEGDSTLEWWHRVHWEYYHRELEGTGFRPRQDMPIVCEYFERVYPSA